MGLLLKGDARLDEALTITASTTENLVYKREFNTLAVQVNKGEKISEYLEKRPGLFSDMLGHMVAIGETAGNLSETFLYLADMYEGEVDDLTKNLSGLIEPVLMVFMGLLVGFIAISIITPIYSVTQKLHA
jgi:type IV pilus assembly protein PilC